jgi:hypothetical protein
MHFAELRPTIRRAATGFGMLTLLWLAPGCASDQQTSASATAGQPSTMGQIRDVILQKPREPSPEEKQAAIANVAETICPPVDVRAGASTLMIPPSGADALSLRYQGSIAELGRECNVSAGIMRMKVGIQGRVLVGPAGGPGQIDVPIRYAVVREGPEPRTVISKFSKLAVAIPPGQQTVLFTHVDSEIAFPMPPGLDIEAYVVYVGFDPIGEKQQPVKKPPAKRTPARG